MKERLLRHALRLSAVVVSLAPVAVALLDSLSWGWAVPLSAAVLAAGETAQRIRALGSVLQ